MRVGRRAEISLTWILIVLFAAFIIPPLYYLIATSLTAKDGTWVGFQNFIDLLTEHGFLESLLNTAIFGAGAMLLALILGTLQAYIVERTNTGFKGLTYLVSIVSLGFPQIIYAVSWTLLLSESGTINSVLQWLSFGLLPPLDVNSLGGMIFIEGLIWTPLVFLTMSAIFRNADTSMEEAAEVSGASRSTIIRLINLPITKPAFYAACLVVFIRTIESFSVPVIVGMPGQVRVLTTDLFMAIRQEIPADYGAAAATAILMLLIVIAVVAYQSLRLKDSKQFQTISGKAFRPRKISLGRWRFLATALLWINFLLLVLLPLLMTLWAAIQRYYSPFSLEALTTNLTFDNIAGVLASSQFLDALGNTLLVALIAATAVTIPTAVASWLIARRRPGSGLLNQLATVPIVFPNIVLALAFAQMFLNALPVFYGTLTLLIVAYATRAIPYGIRYNVAGAMQIQTDLEDSAYVHGASMWTVLRRVIAPLISPSAVAGWLFIFLLTARDLPVALMLAGPNSQMLASVVYDLWQGGGMTQLSAIGLVWACVMFVFAGVFHVITQKFNISAGG